MTILGFDVSNHQWPVDMTAAKAAGKGFVVIKASEGVGFTDPRLAAHRANAHAAGLIVGLYHFARAGNAAQEAAYFLQAIGKVQPGEFLVLDWEVPAADPPGWCVQWLNTVYAGTGIRALIYMNQSAAAGAGWAPVAADHGLWLARYDNSTAQPSIAPWSVAMKQYSSSGAVAGVPGLCDVNAFYGTTDQLRAYGSGGAPTPAPEAADMDAVQAAQLDSITQWTDPNNGYVGVTIRQLEAQVQALTAEVSKAQAPTIDPQALAAALVADTGAVSTLADALAAAIAKRLGNG